MGSGVEYSLYLLHHAFLTHARAGRPLAGNGSEGRGCGKQIMPLGKIFPFAKGT